MHAVLVTIQNNHLQDFSNRYSYQIKLSAIPMGTGGAGAAVDLARERCICMAGGISFTARHCAGDGRPILCRGRGRICIYGEPSLQPGHAGVAPLFSLVCLVMGLSSQCVLIFCCI